MFNEAYSATAPLLETKSRSVGENSLFYQTKLTEIAPNFLLEVIKGLLWGSVLLWAPGTKLPLTLMSIQCQVSPYNLIVNIPLPKRCSKHTTDKWRRSGWVFPVVFWSILEKNAFYALFICVCVFSVSTQKQHRKGPHISAVSRGPFPAQCNQLKGPRALQWLQLRPGG